MAETLVKNQVCSECGSEARPHALFCFHCGGPLQVEEESIVSNDGEPSDVWFRGEIAKTEENEKAEDEKSSVRELRSQKVVEQETEIETQQTADVIREKAEDEKVSKGDKTTKVQIKSKSFSEKNETATDSHPKLRSASALRKKGKPARLKVVEIIWEERESSPNIWFIVFALVVSLLVTALVFIALYIK